MELRENTGARSAAIFSLEGPQVRPAREHYKTDAHHLTLRTSRRPINVK